MAYTSRDGQSLVLAVQKTPLLDLADVDSAHVETRNAPGGEPRVLVMLTPHGRERLGEVTARALHQRIAVVVDGKVCEAPVIQAKLTGPYLPIQCQMNEQQARELAAKIDAAARRK